MPSQNPSDQAITHSAQGRLATNIHLATHFAGWHISFCYKSDLRCASLSAFESALFELLGQLYPARFFFGQAKKKSPKASEATNEAVGPNALNEQATHLLICAERKKK